MTFRSLRRVALPGLLAVMLLAATAPFDVAPVQAQQLPDVSTLFEAQKDAVVSIQIEGNRRSNPFFGDMAPRSGQGSGFVVDPEGYIITNHHVIDGAQKIQVGFENGDSFPATLVGTDPSIDIALLKIEPKKRLPSVALGTSETLKVGQWVVAIGNPYGLNYSVTAGIISAKGRNIGAGPYDNFIQTDASINPGNSGGPLFDLQGRVVGVNTAIIRDGQGIGFAVPVDMVKVVLPQLKNNGYVVRGYIGAGLQPLNDVLASSFGLPRNHGPLVDSLEDGGPAASAGVKVGDVITHFNGKRVRDVSDLLHAVAAAAPGKAAEIRVIRDRKERALNVQVAERPDTRRVQIQPAQNSANSSLASIGVKVRPMDPRLAARMNAPVGKGVLVEAVAPDGIGAQILRPGDIILEVGGKAVNSPAELDKTLAASKSEVVRLLILREGRTTFVAYKVG